MLRLAGTRYWNQGYEKNMIGMSNNKDWIVSREKNLLFSVEILTEKKFRYFLST